MKRLSALSQNYIRNPKLIYKLLRHTKIKKSDLVYDIGAGSGIISYALAKKCKKVRAVEVDGRIIPTLRRNTARFTNVDVLHADFLNLKLPKEPYKVFANIPFHISAKIIRKLTIAPNPPSAAYLIVQRELASKLATTKDGYTSLLAMLIGLRFRVRIIQHLRQQNFTPSPRITPVLICIERRAKPLVDDQDYEHFTSFATTIYGKSQTLVSALSKYVRKGKLIEFMRSRSLPLDTVPSRLPLDAWVELYQTHLKKQGRAHSKL